MSKLFKTSQSKVQCWRTCKRKFWYRYVEQLRRRVKKRPLKFGSIVHEMHEAEAEGHDPFDHLAKIAKEQRKLFREEVEEYGDIITDIGYIMHEYYDFYKKEPLNYIKHEGKFTEHLFEVEVDDGILAKGKIDAFVKYRKLDSILEHKNHKDFPNEDGRWRNVQTSVYSRFVEMLGWLTPEGVLWNYIRNKPPTRPQLLKSGDLSERKLDSLPSVVVDTINAHKLNVKDYRSLIKSQEANRSTWFKRVFNPNRTSTINALFKDFIETSREMADTSHKVKTRNIGRHCSWCDYEPICRASLIGADEDYIIEKEFICDADQEEESDYDPA